MKLVFVLLLCLTNIILRATATYVPYVLVNNDDFPPLFLVAGFLAVLLKYLWKRRPLPVALSTTSTTSTTSTASTTTTPQPRCTDGYTFYPGPGRNFCFRYATDCRSWDDARSACQMDGAELTVLDDESLKPFSDVLRQQFPSEGQCETTSAVWLGAKTDDMLVAKYVDGRSIPQDSTLWVRNEPNRPNDCILVGFDMNTSFLLDRTCGSIVRYVCQRF